MKTGFLKIIDELELCIKKYNQLCSDNFGIIEALEIAPEAAPHELGFDVVESFITRRDTLVTKIKNKLEEIHLFSDANNMFYFDCSSKVYKNTLNERLEKFQKSYPEADDIAFYKFEIQQISNPSPNRFLISTQSNKVYYSKWYSPTLNAEFAMRNKIDFLEKQITRISNDDSTTDMRVHSIKSVDIFKGVAERSWFHNSLIELHAIDQKEQLCKGFQTKANAIFENIKCQANIFRPKLSKAEFIEYLNTRYKAEIKSKYKLPDGFFKYSDSVTDLITSFLA